MIMANQPTRAQRAHIAADSRDRARRCENMAKIEDSRGNRPARGELGMTMGQRNGTAIGYAGLAVFVALAALGMTGTLDDAIVWALGPALVERIVTWCAVLACAAAVVGVHRYAVRRDTIVVHFTPDPNDPDQRHATGHEGRGHAAVGYGVRGNGRGIRAEIEPDGSGKCWVPRKGLTLAESLAITYGGEAAAGPAGCSGDQARFERELRRSPRRYRDNVRREAHSLAHRHQGNSFGRRVERSLLRSGRFH
jgi:hypothetical protein